MRLGIEEEVCPIGVCLHKPELYDFAQAEAQDLRADPVLLLLRKVLRVLSDADAGHEVHGEDLWA